MLTYFLFQQYSLLTVDFLTFLPVWENDQNTINFAYGVHFWKKKYMVRIGVMSSTQWHWFFMILINLIFRPSWIHFGSFLPTKTFWSSKRVLTRHQVWDRPPHLSFVFKICPVHLLHYNQFHNNHDN
jgi:hypothetical protein